jgi:hypothetical protein
VSASREKKLLVSPGATAYALLFGIPSLIGFVIFGALLWWLIKTWRRDP